MIVLAFKQPRLVRFNFIVSPRGELQISTGTAHAGYSRTLGLSLHHLATPGRGSAGLWSFYYLLPICCFAAGKLMFAIGDQKYEIWDLKNDCLLLAPSSLILWLQIWFLRFIWVCFFALSMVKTLDSKKPLQNLHLISMIKSPIALAILEVQLAFSRPACYIFSGVLISF